MKIIGAQEVKSHYIEIEDEEGTREYRRSSADNWERCYGMSWEYEGESEKLEKLFQEYLKERKSKKIKTFEIWSEGWCATGDLSKATKHGECYGSDFGDACENFGMSNDSFKKHLDLKNLTYWGCKLFDNETDARKLFG